MISATVTRNYIAQSQSFIDTLKSCWQFKVLAGESYVPRFGRFLKLHLDHWQSSVSVKTLHDTPDSETVQYPFAGEVILTAQRTDVEKKNKYLMFYRLRFKRDTLLLSKLNLFNFFSR